MSKKRLSRDNANKAYPPNRQSREPRAANIPLRLWFVCHPHGTGKGAFLTLAQESRNQTYEYTTPGHKDPIQRNPQDDRRPQAQRSTTRESQGTQLSS